MQDIENLNQQFAIPGALSFSAGPNDTVMIDIETEKSRAQLSTYGAQVLSFKPAAANEDLLYLSPDSIYGGGKAIRGGVPICWPWFGDDPSGHGRPAHGFARNQVWQVISTTKNANDDIVVSLQLLPNETSRKYWHCDFSLVFKVTIGDSLKMALTTHNVDNESFVISQALHTYFNVGDIERLHLRGLDKHHYLDKTLNFAEKYQIGEVRFVSETDRIYQKAPSETYIEDESLQRQVIIKSQGSKTTVVWNPWNKAMLLMDMPNDAYQQFVCVETANATEDSIELAPGQSHTLVAEYSLTDYV
ncbi:D-hexose-6-phosphate mutarotase [Methylophaga sp. OBS3]|uniref:D-hexose-6-phosphate mutarotase n=1 Tax=Methylophaga sp. OBS3 TaxID=2991934 RepID=UPI00224E52F6|nr:D-hexose-6-phosphate mutarotase [Methylophaga sp. OBS3]MCX4189309.1 D-hexose-6-phosphate mutarotase [Methylophaga sp. OBS3]